MLIFFPQRKIMLLWVAMVPGFPGYLSVWRDEREGGAKKRQEPITKILSKADDVSRPFFQGKRTKRQNGCLLARTVAVFCTL